MYNCEECEYTTDKISNYNAHINTQKHKDKQSLIHPKDIICCQYCKIKLSNNNNLKRHMATCKIKLNLDEEIYNDKLEQIKKELADEYSKKITTIKNKFKCLIKEKDKRLDEKDKQIGEQNKMIHELLQQLRANNNQHNQQNQIINVTNTNNRITHNKLYIFVNENFTNARDYNDIMKNPLSRQELRDLQKGNATHRCIDLLNNRCIQSLKPNERPVYTLNLSDNVYENDMIVKIDGQWKLDDKGEIIFNGMIPRIQEAHKNYLPNEKDKELIIKNFQIYTSIDNALKQLGHKKIKTKRKIYDSDDILSSDSDCLE